MVNVQDKIKKSSRDLADVEIGTAFLGTVGDIEGYDHTGLFVRSSDGVVFLEDLTIEFASFHPEDRGYSPDVFNFREVDIEIDIVSYA